MSILNLAWLIPLFPFLAFAAIPLVTYRNRKLSHQLVIGGIGLAFVLSQIVFWAAVALPVGGGEHAFESTLVPWLSAGVERFTLGVYIDPATAVMLFMVPLVCLMIFIYSVGYMNFGTPEVDPRYSRFFSYLSLFATGMLGMVVFNNLLAFFIFWEIMGTCSYLLIGFWYEKTSAFQAGLKAFLVTKVGDLFFMLGLALLYAEVGSLAYRDIFSVETLEHLAHTPFLSTPLSVASVIALLIFGGTVGKSAQFPLHVWLPDAMEGPTPVSALIHAATMVSAGVFLVVRTFPLFAAAGGGVHMMIVAAIGAFTAIFSSVIAVAQNDIKRVLAFSTISQLGYMVAALGIGAYVAGAFHLITHAFFKALLFLGSGSVIHGMEHGHHHAHAHGEHHEEHEEHKEHGHEAFDPNDMRNMGGLAKRMPRTFWTFLIGGLALSGFPLVTAGFWSKDEILAQAYELCLLGAGRGRWPDRLLHHAPDLHDLPRPAAHERRRARSGERAFHDGATDDPGGLRRGGRLGRHPGEPAAHRRGDPQLVPSFRRLDDRGGRSRRARGQGGRAPGGGGARVRVAASGAGLDLRPGRASGGLAGLRPEAHASR